MVLVGIAPFEVFQKTSDGLATRRENGQANHDEKDTLQNGEEKAENSKPDEEPTNDEKSDLLKFVHGIGVFIL